MLLDDAINLACKVHYGELRKGLSAGHGLPYITHPLEVLKLVWQWGCGSEVIGAAAVLHDTIEDANNREQAELIGKSIEELSPETYILVTELTKPSNMPKGKYLETFNNTELTSVGALVIKTADRICNVKDFMMEDPRYAVKYFNKAWILGQALLNRQEEIIKTFGPETYRKILKDYKMLEMEINSLNI